MYGRDCKGPAAFYIEVLFASSIATVASRQNSLAIDVPYRMSEHRRHWHHARIISEAVQSRQRDMSDIFYAHLARAS